EARRRPDDNERLGGEDLMVLVDGHYVGVTRDGPEWTERTVGLIVDRSLVAQPLEVVLPAPLTIEEGVAEIDVGELDLIDRRDGLLDEELLPIRPGNPATRLVVQMCALDLQIHRDGRLHLGGDC